MPIDLSRVSPILVAAIGEINRLLAPTAVRITSGYRSATEQDALYAQGRTAPGSVVTQARGGQSMHNYGLAVDVAFVRADNPRLVEWPEPGAPRFALWAQLGAAVQRVGGGALEWGGAWQFIDRPHIQHRITLTELRAGRWPRLPAALAAWDAAQLTALVAAGLGAARVQRLLADLGYRLGAVDGAIGPRTVAAVREFQGRHSPPADGALRPDTLARLLALHRDLVA